MIKSTIFIAALCLLLGLLVGSHESHIRVHQAADELFSRNWGIDRKTCNSAFQSFVTLRAKSLVRGGVIESMDSACDGFLECLCFPKPNFIKEASNAQLYHMATFDEGYRSAQNLVFYSQAKRNYCEGRNVAKVGMAIRGSGELHNTSRESRFAESLIYFGMYSDAEAVLNNLLPVKVTIGESDTPEAFLQLRREFLAEALLGQQKYQEVADRLNNLATEPSNFHLIYLRGIALLALHRDKEALESFRSQPLERPSLFIELCSPALNDEVRKDEVIRLAESYSNDTIGASDDVPALELAVDVLQRRGFDEAAARIAEDIRVLTQN